MNIAEAIVESKRIDTGFVGQNTIIGVNMMSV